MRKNKSEPLTYQSNESLSSGFIGRHTIMMTVFLVVTFIGLQVVITNLSSDNGMELHSLEARRQILLKTNEQAQGELALLGSLSRIEREALNNLGMKPSAEKLDFLVPPRLAWQSER